MRSRILNICLALAMVCALVPLNFGDGAAHAAQTTTVASSAAAPDKDWQIVANNYATTATTSKDMTADQVVEAVKQGTMSASDDIRLTKTVESTGVENKFRIHLSIDARTVGNVVTDYKAYFESAAYEAVTSNKEHSSSLGDVISGVTGSAISVGGPNDYSTGGYFDIQDPDGKTIAEGVHLTWSKANNFTIYLKLSNDQYVLIGLSVTAGATNTCKLSEEAYKLIKASLQEEVIEGSLPTLNQVKDTMGATVEYAGGAKADGGATSYDDSSRTLTWNPKVNATYTSSDPREYITEERNSYGAVTSVTVYKESWHYAVATLTYDVSLDVTSSDFLSSYDPAEVTNAFDTNAQAVLTYNDTSSLEFPSPKVKGVLYDLRLRKVSGGKDAKALADAQFALFSDAECTTPITDKTGTPLTANSEVDTGYVEFTGLPLGTYYVKETSAPSGYEIEGDGISGPFTIAGYQVEASAYVESDLVSHHALLDLAGGEGIIVNPSLVSLCVAKYAMVGDDQKPLGGSTFCLSKKMDDGTYQPADVYLDKGLTEAAFEGTTSDDDGFVTFCGMGSGEYRLEEVYVPAGYTKLAEPIYLTVTQKDGSLVATATYAGSEAVALNFKDGCYIISVQNFGVDVMPSTGGFGMAPVLSLGFVLMGCSGAVMVLSRGRGKGSNEETLLSGVLDLVRKRVMHNE